MDSARTARMIVNIFVFKLLWFLCLFFRSANIRNFFGLIVPPAIKELKRNGEGNKKNLFTSVKNTIFALAYGH